MKNISSIVVKSLVEDGNKRGISTFTGSVDVYHRIPEYASRERDDDVIILQKAGMKVERALALLNISDSKVKIDPDTTVSDGDHFFISFSIVGPSDIIRANVKKLARRLGGGTLDDVDYDEEGNAESYE
jgi:hypothetical protein